MVVLETGSDDLCLSQAGGGLPTVLASGSAPGESGVSVCRVRFRNAVHIDGTARQHVIYFHVSPRTRVDCSIAGQWLRHEVFPGALGICPAGVSCEIDANQSAEAILVAIRPTRLALAAAESAVLEARLLERLRYHDRTLLELARILTLESAAGYPNGTLFWNEVADRF